MSQFKWSYTKIVVFQECLRKFKLQFIDKVGGAIKVDAFAIGEGLHQFLEFYSVNHDATLEECEAKYVKGAMEHPALKDKAQIEINKPLVERYMNSGLVLTPLRDTAGKPLVERWFNIDCGNGVTCIGKIDIVTANHAVVDYKSASRPFQFSDVTETLENKGLQLTIYAAAYAGWFDKPPTVVGFQVLVKNGSEVQQLGVSRSTKDIDEVKNLIRFIDAKYKGLTHFPKNKFANCHWCNFKNICEQQED